MHPPLVVIAGPTASGKSAHALRLAETRGGTIINADASQLYADLRILSARPTANDEARVPHRLYGVLDAADPCSAARWAAMAQAEIDASHKEGRVPILVGGTGLYLATLIDGIAPVPPIDPAIRTEVRALPSASIRAALEAEDPSMAARLRPSDPQRNARALEVIRSTGRSLADWQRDRTDGLLDAVALETHLLLPDRAALTARAEARFDAMLADGALDEVARLLGRNLPADLPAMKALGVPPLAAHLRGEISLAQAADRAKLDTRRYIKRQFTWFATGGRAKGWLAVAIRLPDARPDGS
ncbi:MAG: tRNA (adenosine(37)-N6)-dimethylallyltransferase MiaA [Thermaurantiacus sp.]